MKSPLPLQALVLVMGFLFCVPAMAQRQMETLNRGIVAIRKSSSQVYLSWRLFGNDPADVAFNLYRSTNGGTAAKLNAFPLTATTDYTDTPGSLSTNDYSYFVRPVISGIEQANSETAALPANADQKQFFTLPLRQDTGPDGPYDVKFCWVGDLDGDGDYDFVVDRLSTQGAYEQFLEAYTNDGTFLWRMAMGPNSVNQYAYEPGSSAISIGDSDNLTVYDMDGDGRAEVLVRTANGVTVRDASDTQVASITAASDSTQFLSVIDGLSGAELARATMPNAWATHGTLTNKAMIAYLDGRRPSVVMYGYNRADTSEFYRQFTAFDFRDGALTQRWTLPQTFPGSEGHQIRIADVDNDGKDEICDIGHVIDDDGTQLFNTELTHGDRFHIADINPDRPGLETFAIQQYNPTSLATTLYESGTGSMIKKWYSTSPVDVGRGIALDINSAHKGYEMFSTQPGIFNAKGKQIYVNNVWAPEGLWWDGDLGREFIDGAGSGALSPVINKFNAATGGTSRVWSLYNDWGNYSTRQAYGGRPAFWGDILGDWREELVLIQSDYSALRIYTTTAPATNRLYTLMHNPQYRCQATTKGYVQASYVDYYLGFGMSSAVPPPPMAATDLTWSGGATWGAGSTSSWKNNAGVSSVFAQGNSVLFDISGSNSSPVALSGTLSPAAVNFFNPQDFTMQGSAGSLEGSMTLSKSGKGKVTLTGTHGYTGTTTIWDGALLVDGQLSNSPVTVWGGIWGGALAMGETGGRLSGAGAISQPVSLEYRGTIAPGAGMGSAGTLNLGSSLTAKDGAVFALDLSDDPSGVSKPNDKITVAGNLILSGTVFIDIVPSHGSLAPGNYTLLTYGGTLTGSESNIGINLPEGTAHTLTVGAGAITLNIPVTRAPDSLTWKGGDGGNAWDLAATANWLLSGSPEAFVSGDAVTFNESGSVNPTINLTTALPTAGVTVDSSADYNFTGEGAIAGAGGLSKSGDGTLTLATTNTYTGPTIISGGTLAVDNLNDGGVPSSIGASGSSASNLVIDGGTLALVGEQTNTNRSMTIGAAGATFSVPTSLQVSGQLIGSGSLTKAGTGTLILANANSYSGGTFISGGKIQLASDTANASGLGTGTITFHDGTLSMTDNSSSYNSASYNIDVPAGKAGRLNADGRVFLSGTLTGDGDFTIYLPYVRADFRGNWSAFNGTLHAICDTDGGDFRIDNNFGYGGSILDLGSGVYAYYIGSSSNPTIALGGLSGAAGAVLRGGASGTTTWQVGGRNEDSTFAGVIDGGATALTKVGSGTLTLFGACTHSGATTVSAGRLRVSGSTNGTNIAVESGATLGGTGSITGNVTVESGGALELDATPLAITGDISFSGSAVVRSAGGGSFSPGTYTLLNYSGSLSGTPTFSWEPPLGSNLTATFDTGTQGVISITLALPPREAGLVTWTGATSFNWDTATTNWMLGPDPTAFMTGDSVSYTDAGNADSAINIASNVEPAAVLVDASIDYTLSGSGAISGEASLTKSGSGTLTISSAQSFTGGTTINAGTIAISNPAALGAGTVTLNGGIWATGTLAPQNAIVVTADSGISGGHGGGQHAVKGVSGGGVLTLTATNVFDLEGDLSGFSGTFALAGSGSFRFFNSSNNGSAAATFDLGTRSLQARSGSAFSLGALVGQSGSILQGAGGGGNNTWVTYTIGGNDADSTFAGAIINGNATTSIVKTGAGTLTLTGASTYTGTTIISSGELFVTGSLAATPVTVEPAGALGGTGVIGGFVSCDGVLAPGASLALASGLTLSASSTLDYELGSSSDLTAVTGNLILDGTVDVTATAGFGPGTYTLITYTGSLTNNGLDLGEVPEGYVATVDTATAGQVKLVVIPSNTAPQITSGPTPSASEITLGTDLNLTVTATDDGGEETLTYTWSATGPAAVSFSPNADNAARNTSASYSAPGSYTLTVTVTDGPGLFTEDSTGVTVTKAPAVVTLQNLSATYDGFPKTVATSTDPDGLDVIVTYDASASAPVTPGVYQVAATVDDPNYSGEAADSLVISPRSFESWETDAFTPEQIAAGESAMDQDPDRDGLTNLAEFALGGLPYSFTPQPAVTTNETSMSITFQRPAWIGDIGYHAEAGADFETWSEIMLEILNPGDDPETVRATYTFPAPKADRQFLRLRFER